jgi:hypothetical protein
MNEQRIEIGTVDLPQKGARYFQPTVKEYVVDEWRAMGYESVRIVREGIRVIIEPVEKDKVCST